MLKKIKNIYIYIYIYIYKILANSYEERLIYLQNFIRKTLFFNIFGLFHLYSKKIKIPVVNKYHQHKVLSVSKNAKKIHMGTVLDDRAIVIQSVTVLKAENWPGQEEVKSVWTSS
ncbi:unnamed protein product, partial [Staurois parvus]